MLAKMRGEPFDGIPFATYNLHPFDGHAADSSYAGLLELVRRKAGMLVKHGLKRLTPGWNLTAVTEESATETRTTQTWRTPKGTLRCVSVKPKDQPGYVMEHFIKDEADVAKVMSMPVPAKVDFGLVETRALLAKVGESGVLYVGYPDPMYSAASLFDYEDFVVRCATEPDLLQELIEYQAAGIYVDVEAMASACEGLPVLFYAAGPEVATPPMVPPRIFTRFVTPFQKKIVAIFHRHGLRAGIHCHGRVRQVLDDLLEIGIDTLEPLEPPNQGDITLQELLAKVAGRICLMGYIQDQDFYCAAPGEMRRKVQEVVDVISPSDRYIMTPTCTPFQFPASRPYLNAYTEWVEAAAELLP